MTPQDIINAVIPPGVPALLFRLAVLVLLGSIAVTEWKNWRRRCVRRLWERERWRKALSEVER